MNKKAQVGKTIITPFVMLAVTVIMVIFVFLSANVAIFNPEQEIDQSDSELSFLLDQPLPESDIFFQPINVGEKRTTPLREIITAIKENRLNNNALQEAQKGLANEQKDCSYIRITYQEPITETKTQEIKYAAGYVYSDGHYFPTRENELRDIPIDKLEKSQILIYGKEYEIETYWGACA